jgi:hypothetical protein
LFQITALILVVTALWTGWAERHPGEERALRTLVHDQLDDWFPELMSPAEDDHGLFLRVPAAQTRRPRVLLIHGLDEPGIIWDDLAIQQLEAWSRHTGDH